MLAKVVSQGLMGIQGHPISVEVDISNGLPSYETVGLPDAAVKESRERVRAAIRNSGFLFPINRLIINLAPADVRKEGTTYDLPIAVGILAASEQIPKEKLNEYIILGELELDGTIRSVAGVLPMLIDARRDNIFKVILPKGNAAEASYIEGITLFPAGTLAEVADFLKGKAPIDPYPKKTWDPSDITNSSDFSEIKGQQGAKRAAEIAVAGGHNILLIGTPGSGKTMLAKSIPSILPELTLDEALEITKIHSIMGSTKNMQGIISERPYRSPHHSTSIAALIGGGIKALPGEISLAHYGVLFLDEMLEFKKEALEALRQPMEDRQVSIVRANVRATYPADFMLVAAMNPCPCGNYGSRINRCRCTPAQVAHYQSRISAPVMDRIDIYVNMTEVAYSDIISKSEAEKSENIRARVNLARKRQFSRYAEERIIFNAQLNNRQLKKYCALSAEGEAALEKAFTSLKLSARAYTRILKVARTIADLEGSEAISVMHIAEAVQYRNLDKKMWNE